MARPKKTIDYRLNFEAGVLDYFKSKRKKWKHDRTKTIGASEIGKCARAVVADKRNVPADEGYVENLGMAQRGDVMENYFTAPLVRFMAKQVGGRAVHTGQSNQMTLIDPESERSATPDGMLVDLHPAALQAYGVKDIEFPRILVEAKSIDPRFGKEKLPKEEHVAQATQQLGLARMKGFDVTWCIIVYVDASDYSDVRVFPVRYEGKTFASQSVRAKSLMTFARSDKDWHQLMPEGKMLGGTQCRYCKIAQSCLGFAPWLPKENQAVPEETAIALATEAELIDADETELAEREKAIAERKAKLRAKLANEGVRYLRKGKVEVSWSEAAGRSTTDYDGLKAELRKRGGDPDKYTKQGKPGERLSISVATDAGKPVTSKKKVAEPA